MGNILMKLCSSVFPCGGGTVEKSSALSRHLSEFEQTGQVPDELDGFVQSSRAAQRNWYGKLLAAWKASPSPPIKREEISQFVIQTLRGHKKVDVEGLLSFYGLSSSSSSALEIPSGKKITTENWPHGVQYELCTLPVEGNGATDGDTLTVLVDVRNNARESATIPVTVQAALSKWRIAQQRHDDRTVKALQKEIQKAGYKLLDSNSTKGYIARQYKVRLRGIDAPESSMPFGPEAKAMLQSLVEKQPLRLLVYTVDMYGRLVADVHCKKGFVQEILLKNGACWHYNAYDKREELAKWEEEARLKGLGLWEMRNPQKPWEYRKENKRKL